MRFGTIQQPKVPNKRLTPTGLDGVVSIQQPGRIDTIAYGHTRTLANSHHVAPWSLTSVGLATVLMELI